MIPPAKPAKLGAPGAASCCENMKVLRNHEFSEDFYMYSSLCAFVSHNAKTNACPSYFSAVDSSRVCTRSRSAYALNSTASQITPAINAMR